MNILTQNSKMKKSSKNGIDVYNFGIPAFQSKTGLRTCPNAGSCASGCYAKSGTYNFNNVIKAYEDRLQLTQDKDFIEIMSAEINLKYLKSKTKGNKCLIRIHDSGDFYSKDYARAWIRIIENNPNVEFYAYTKMVQLFEDYIAILPKNFKVIYSFGGKQDAQIDINKHYHSKVFDSVEALQAQGYTDATNDDLIAALGTDKKIGLVYHGIKKYANTNWNKVA